MRPKHLSILFILAFAVRLAFVVQWHATAYGDTPILDGIFYHQWAQDIAEGHLSHGRAFYVMPFYPYVLGLAYFFFGHSLWVPSVLNAVLDAGTCVILADLTALAFGPVAAVTTGILAAFYRPLIFYTPLVMKETLGLFLLALFVSVSYRALRSGKTRAFVWSGISLGLCGLVRGNALALVVVILGFIFWQERARSWKNGGAVLIGMIAVIIPVTLHNAVTSHDFVLTSYADGFNAYIGNGAVATGTSYYFPPDISSNPGSEEFNVVRSAELASGKRLRPSQVDSYWWHKTIDYARANPERELSLLRNKIKAFWSNNEPYDSYDMSFIARHFGTIIALPLANFGLVTAMALFAMIAMRNTKRSEMLFFGVLILAYMLTLVPFYVTDRYRLPVVIFLLPLAGAAIPAARALYREKKMRQLAVAGLAALIPFGLIFAPQDINPADEAFNWGTLCGVYEEEGYHIASIIALNQALADSPHTVDAAAWIKGADALDHLGHHKEAEDEMKKLEAMFPTDGTVPYNIGRMAFIDEDYPAAFAAFQKAIDLMPTFPLAYRGLAAVYDHYGDRAKAMETIQKGLEVVPGDPVLMEVVNGFNH